MKMGEKIFERYINKKLIEPCVERQPLITYPVTIYKGDLVGIYSSRNLNLSSFIMAIAKQCYISDNEIASMVYISGDRPEWELNTRLKRFLSVEESVIPISLSSLSEEFKETDLFGEGICFCNDKIREDFKINFLNKLPSPIVLFWDNTETLFKNYKKLDEEDSKFIISWAQELKRQKITTFWAVPPGRNREIIPERLFDAIIDLKYFNAKSPNIMEIKIFNKRNILNSMNYLRVVMDEDESGLLQLRNHKDFTQDVLLVAGLLLNGKNQSEVAEILNISQPTVSRRWHRAIDEGLVKQIGPNRYALTTAVAEDLEKF